MWPGNRNALKHGRYSREAIEFRRRVRELVREARGLVKTAFITIASLLAPPV